MSQSVHDHREAAPEYVRLAVVTISDTRTPRATPAATPSRS